MEKKIDQVEIKKVLIENLFACTDSTELTKDRIVEIASEIAPFVVKVVNEQLEKSSNNDLEAEIEMVRKYHFIYNDFDKVELDGRRISNIAHHFANWQKKQIIRKISQWLDENVPDWIDMSYDQKSFVQKFKNFIKED